MANIIERIRDEHANMAKLLDALERQVAVFDGGGKPDYEIVLSVLDYFLDYPDRCHHPKEDLLARKIGMKKGAVFMNLLGEIQKTVARAKETNGLDELAGQLETAVNRLGEIALHIGQKAMSPEFKVAFAHALPFLYAMGDTIMAWMLLWRAVVATQKLDGAKKKDAAYYEGQRKTAEFFIKTELPLTLGKMNAIESSCAAALEIPDDGFGGI